MARLQQQYSWSPQELACYDTAEKRHRQALSRLTQAEARGLQQGCDAALERFAQKQDISLEEAIQPLKP